ncbi:cytochrome P450 [Carbonactinospora thermoautotrophica]|uniref:Cytochrome P450 n=1 Tax=Carbonactinospora thermoautotrophica TaxID=1469144 RepID=A0A132N4J9_9ACTN|nr:cytochrome P450 [Carbonactinospora thermoautotrophica]KWX05079.1 cytochrome P450 [Carbonactinospora thermoautotrophica]KWX08650.1 cytochrome P450 [Carbonactinospora thermoautotrophica]MCX9191681.1 cytochrome P450 [Carbonactinospora thermoautotrophica]
MAEPLPEVPDLFSDAFLQDQYRTYAWLVEHRPVSRVRWVDGTELWLVTRYDDAKALLADPRVVNDLKKQTRIDLAAMSGLPPEVQPYFLHNVLNTDPPDHTRLRKLVNKAFTPRRVQELRPRVQEITDGLLDRIGAREEVDLLEEFAYPLPVTVICELLGVPVADRGRFRAWTAELIAANPEQPERIAPAARQLLDFTFELIEKRRHDPGEDLVSALVQVHDEDGDRLSDQELAAMVITLLVAGHETTVHLIGNGTYALLTHPDQLARLRSDPGLLPRAIEEFLRFHSPAEIAGMRYTIAPVEVSGVTIPAGEPVLIALGAADRDPARFPDADRLDVTRDDNPHVAFGHGLHFCLGAALARAEGEIAIGALLRRFPDLALAVPPEEIRWRPTFLRGLTRLPVRLRA